MICYNNLVALFEWHINVYFNHNYYIYGNKWTVSGRSLRSNWEALTNHWHTHNYTSNVFLMSRVSFPSKYSAKHLFMSFGWILLSSVELFVVLIHCVHYLMHYCNIVFYHLDKLMVADCNMSRDHDHDHGRVNNYSNFWNWIITWKHQQMKNEKMNLIKLKLSIVHIIEY